MRGGPLAPGQPDLRAQSSRFRGGIGACPGSAALAWGGRAALSRGRGSGEPWRRGPGRAGAAAEGLEPARAAPWRRGAAGPERQRRARTMNSWTRAWRGCWWARWASRGPTRWCCLPAAHSADIRRQAPALFTLNLTCGNLLCTVVNMPSMLAGVRRSGRRLGTACAA